MDSLPENMHYQVRVCLENSNFQLLFADNFFNPTMRTKHTQKFRDKAKPYISKPGPKTPQNVPATSAISTKSHQCRNLTVNDWLTVFAFIDAHPHISQTSVCDHFCSLANGAPLTETQEARRSGGLCNLISECSLNQT